jgi:hypothetical protein
MRNGAVSETSFLGLLREFKTEVTVLIKQEIDLAKAEMSEKISHFGKHAMFMAIGGFVAYAGLIVLLIGLGAIVAYAFEALGLSTTMSHFLGWTIIGLLVAGTGGAFIMKALKGFKEQSFVPEKTIDTLRQAKGQDENMGPEHEPAVAHPVPEPKLSSDTIKSNIEVTQSVIEETSEEIAHRMSPHYMGEVVKNHVRTHPVQTSLIGVGTGLVGYLWFKRKHPHHNGNNHHDADED